MVCRIKMQMNPLHFLEIEAEKHSREPYREGADPECINPLVPFKILDLFPPSVKILKLRGRIRATLN
jgi:hypothetical protein